jgi:hypothetical protein
MGLLTSEIKSMFSIEINNKINEKYKNKESSPLNKSRKYNKYSLFDNCKFKNQLIKEDVSMLIFNILDNNLK